MLIQVLAFLTAVVALFVGAKLIMNIGLDNQNIIGDGNTASQNTTNINLNGSGGKVVVGDENTTYNNTYQSTNNTFVEVSELEGSTDELLQAHFYCMDGEYDKAKLIYEKQQYQTDKAVMINLGYIYANKDRGDEEDALKAIHYYQQADCVEAKRNLYVCYLKNGMVDEAKTLFEKFLNAQDEVFLNYLARCYDLASLDEVNAKINSTSVDELWSNLFEWEATNQLLTGFAEELPYDTLETRWVLQNADVETGENKSHTVATYRMYIYRFAKGYGIMEECYCTQNGELCILSE